MSFFSELCILAIYIIILEWNEENGTEARSLVTRLVSKNIVVSKNQGSVSKCRSYLFLANSSSLLFKKVFCSLDGFIFSGKMVPKITILIRIVYGLIEKYLHEL